MIFPAGLTYLQDFIAPTQETQLMAQIDRGIWNYDLRRRTQHFGYRYDYKAKMVLARDKLGKVPDWLLELASLLVQAGFFITAPDQIIINEYMPGQGIAPHIDCLPCFGQTIASLSLCAPVVMDFDRITTGEKNAVHKTALTLAPRSLLVLQGEARHAWRHGIAARKSDEIRGKRVARSRRVSLTFREILLVR